MISRDDLILSLKSEIIEKDLREAIAHDEKYVRYGTDSVIARAIADKNGHLTQFGETLQKLGYKIEVDTGDEFIRHLRIFV